MLTKEKMKIVDESKMYETYDNWPEIAKNSFNNDLKEIMGGNIAHIILAGMGGSGTIGDVIASILSKTDTHVDVVKGYHLPKTVKQNSLLICTSVSGNTIETITVLKEGIELGCQIIVFSSGGELKKISNDKKIEYREITMNHSLTIKCDKFAKIEDEIEQYRAGCGGIKDDNKPTCRRILK